MNKLYIIAVLLMGFTSIQAQMNMKIRLTNGDLISYPTSTIDSIYFEPQCIISNLTAGTQTPCDSLTNEYTQDIIITYTNAPSSGSLSVNGQMFSVTTSPQTITLSNLISDANPVDVDAFFTVDTSCTLIVSSLFTAPVSCAVCTPVFSTMTDSRDSEVYQTVTICNQTWMAENLRYNASGSWLNPNNPSASYGRLYDWATVMNGATTSASNPSAVQGICPSGWHLPSDSEWNEMEMALGMSAVDTADTGYRDTHGTGMKSTTGWNSSGNGTNASGFNAFPAGAYSWSSFSSLGGYSYFWSSTEVSSTAAWRRFLSYADTGVVRSSFNKTSGYSCRCVKD